MDLIAQVEKNTETRDVMKKKRKSLEFLQNKGLLEGMQSYINKKKSAFVQL
jgi:hypothetical protein